MPVNSIVVRSTLTATILTLSACGGGGSAPDNTQAPPPEVALPVTPPITPAGPTVSVDASTFRTIAGGVPVTLKATASDNSAVSWKLGDGVPGSLSAASGNTVTYLPPPGGISGTTAVPITASAGGTSQVLTLELSPSPGAPGLTLIAGRQDVSPPNDKDGIGPDAVFSPIHNMAADGSGNLYLFTGFDMGIGARKAAPYLRKIDTNGKVTTLIGSLRYLDRPNADAFNGAMRYFNGLVADRAGNLYMSEFGIYSPAAIYKMTPSGEFSLFAGDPTFPGPAAVIKDGTGKEASFITFRLSGIDGDGNLYGTDGPVGGPTVFRKITQAGKVTTIASLPAALNADFAGNTYRAGAAQTIARITSDGKKSTVAGTAYCTNEDLTSLPGCLRSIGPIAPLGGGAYAVVEGRKIVKFVVPTEPEPTTAILNVSASTIQTIAGYGLFIGATSNRSASLSWRLGDGAPGKVEIFSDIDSASYTPPNDPVTSPISVPVIVSGGGISTTLTLTVSPDPGPYGLFFVAGQSNAVVDRDGIGADAAFVNPIMLAPDSKGTVYVAEAQGSPGTARALRLRKVSAGGSVSTLVNAGSWFGSSDTAHNGDKLLYASGMAADRNGNLYIANSMPNNGGIIYKIAPGGAMTVLAGAEGHGTSVFADGKAAQARFVSPQLAGIDADGNIYVNDGKGTASVRVRKVAPDGTVTTLSELPYWLGADLRSLHYAIKSDASPTTIVEYTFPGVTSVEFGLPSCTDLFVPGDHITACPGNASLLVQSDAATYYMFSNKQLVKMVVLH